MKKRRFILYGAVLFAAPVVLHQVYERFAEVVSAATAAKFAVPQVTLEFREVLDSIGKRRISTRRIVAYRADGAFSETVKKFRLNGEEIQNRTLRFASGVRIIVNDSIKVKSTWNLPQSEYVKWRDATHYNPADQCTSDLHGGANNRVFVRTEERAGLRTVLIQNSGSGGIDVWYAPSLGCLEVGRLARFRNSSGKESDSSELILEQHRLGEPDTALFEIAADYEEVDPVEAARRLYKKLGAAPIYLDRMMADPSLKRLAESYAKHRAQ